MHCQASLHMVYMCLLLWLFIFLLPILQVPKKWKNRLPRSLHAMLCRQHILEQADENAVWSPYGSNVTWLPIQSCLWRTFLNEKYPTWFGPLWDCGTPSKLSLFFHQFASLVFFTTWSCSQDMTAVIYLRHLTWDTVIHLHWQLYPGQRCNGSRAYPGNTGCEGEYTLYVFLGIHESCKTFAFMEK